MKLKNIDLEDVTGIRHISLSENPIKSGFNNISQINKSNQTFDDDDFLSDLLKVLKIKSLVIGVGGAGNNAVSRLQEMGLENTETLNINTDAHDLYYSNSKLKLLIGKDRCKGLGSGNNPTVGLEAAEEDVDRLKKILNTDIVFLTCGLGGGTGTGAAPIIAREAKRNNALVVTLCSIPFKSEGPQRRMRAKIGLKKLAEYSDTIIPLPNDLLLEYLPNGSLISGFKIMDEVLIRSIKEVVNLINNCGLINIDYADVKKVFEKSGKYPSGLIGITETLGNEDIIQKSKLAIHNPLLKPNTNEVDRCLISVSSDHNLSLSNVDKIVSTISNEVPQDAKIKFGANMDPNLENSKIKIMVVGRGPISPYVRAAVDSDEDISFQ